MSRLLLPALLLAASTALADPSTDLESARAAHKEELRRLRAQLLADIDAVIRKESDAGAGVDYLLKERRGFEQNGVTPILPKLLPAGRKYEEGKQASEEALAKALEKAGRKEEAQSLRGKPPAAPATGKKVETKAELRENWVGSVWDMGDGLTTLKPDGHASHPQWDRDGYVTTWEAVDRRTVLLAVVRGRDTNRLAVFSLSEDLRDFTGYGFNG
jgi:hypothetical protein